MQEHYQLSDEDFKNAFITCSLNPSLFTHEAHLRLAFILIAEDGIDKALEDIQMHIENFVKHVGAMDKYNKTVTITAIKIVNHYMQKSNAENFKDFIHSNPQLKNNFKELISAHYSIDIFNSKSARENYLLPDKISF